MKISFNPSNSNKNILDLIKNNKDIIFDLKGHSIFARGVEFKGTDTNTWRPVVDNLTSDSTTSSLSAKQGKVLKALIDGKSNSDHNHDGRYLKLTGGTMLGALNFANNTWNLVGDDSYIGDCNISGHFGIKAANTTYPGITFFNNASTFLGNLTAYSGNIKYGAYSLQFLDNGNTSVSASTWTNPFSNYNSNAVADGQAICVWGQSSYLSNLSTDTGDMSLWLKRINANAATLNMVLDGEYYANGNQRLAHVSEIPNKDSWNYDDRYLRLTGGWMSGDINFGGDNKIYWGRNTDSASISFKNDGDVDADSYMSFVTSDNGNEYFRWSHISGSTNTEWMALRSDGLRVRGTKVSLEGHTHDDRYYTKAESNVKYITDITTSVNKLTFTRNGSNIIRDITVNVVHSQGRLTNIPNKDATTKASPGLLIYDSYEQTIGTNSYSSVLSINTGGTIQIAGDWGDDHARNLYWRSQSDGNVADYPWKSWRTILDSENYSSTLDSRYYTESEVNSLLSRKLDRVNLTTGSWNPRGYHLAADYNYNGGDLSISENNGKMYISVDGCFWQNEGQYRVLDTSDIGDIRGSVTLHQFLSATDATWYPLIWGGNSHSNISDSTGAVYKSYDKLSWQTSSQTLYATNIQTNNIKNLSIGGGIYWDPNVESASNNTDAASITLVRSGVAGGTTLVLSQMNDTNDTIQFKTNTAARLYHNSYPILTTQNTSVSNNKGYINGTEITQVNNSDTLDGIHANGLLTTLSNSNNGISITVGGTTKSISNINVNYATSAASAGNANTLDGIDSTRFLRQVVVPNNTENDFNTFSNMTLTGRADPHTGASLKNAPWSGSGPAGGYGVLTYLFNGSGYGTQMAWGYNDNRIYIRNRSWGGSGVGPAWRTSWDTLALTSDIPTVTNYYWANVKISASSSTTTSPTVHTLTATRVCAGHNPGIDNSISCSNWFRSSGNTGWYNTTYQGGWYMSDTSWIRAHNGVGIYTSGQIYSSSSIRMGNILLEHTNEINNSANDSIHLNLRNSGNVSLCVGGGKVGIGTMYPSQELYVLGYTYTKGFGIGIQYLSESGLLPTISPGDGYTYRCLEIGRPTKVSCIIADKVPLSGVRGILLKFMQGFDGQIVLLKDLENYGSGNGNFWVMPFGCKIINADNSNILINQNQISHIYDDSRSRFFIYSSKYCVWIEFFCSNIY